MRSLRSTRNRRRSADAQLQMQIRRDSDQSPTNSNDDDEYSVSQGYMDDQSPHEKPQLGVNYSGFDERGPPLYQHEQINTRSRSTGGLSHKSNSSSLADEETAQHFNIRQASPSSDDDNDVDGDDDGHHHHQHLHHDYTSSQQVVNTTIQLPQDISAPLSPAWSSSVSGASDWHSSDEEGSDSGPRSNSARSGRQGDSNGQPTQKSRLTSIQFAVQMPASTGRGYGGGGDQAVRQAFEICVHSSWEPVPEGVRLHFRRGRCISWSNRPHRRLHMLEMDNLIVRDRGWWRGGGEEEGEGGSRFFPRPLNAYVSHMINGRHSFVSKLVVCLVLLWGIVFLATRLSPSMPGHLRGLCPAWNTTASRMGIPQQDHAWCPNQPFHDYFNHVTTRVIDNLLSAQPIIPVSSSDLVTENGPAASVAANAAVPVKQSLYLAIDRLEKDLREIASECRWIAKLASRGDIEDTCYRVQNKVWYVEQSISDTAELIEVAFYAGESSIHGHGGRLIGTINYIYWHLDNSLTDIEAKITAGNLPPHPHRSRVPSEQDFQEGVLRYNATARAIAGAFYSDFESKPFMARWISAHSKLLHDTRLVKERLADLIAEADWVVDSLTYLLETKSYLKWLDQAGPAGAKQHAAKQPLIRSYWSAHKPSMQAALEWTERAVPLLEENVGLLRALERATGSMHDKSNQPPIVINGVGGGWQAWMARVADFCSDEANEFCAFPDLWDMRWQVERVGDEIRGRLTTAREDFIRAFKCHSRLCTEPGDRDLAGDREPDPVRA